jgi:hypothetical protein
MYHMTKKKNFVKFTFSLICLFFFTSCEKELKLTLPASPASLVVEGEIENGQMPQLLLTYSTGFFDKIDFGKIKFAKDAIVSVTDINTNFTAKMVPLGIPYGAGPDSIFYIFIPENIPANEAIRGQIDHTYQLNISDKGTLHTGVTKVANQALPDSIWLEKIPADSGFNVRVRYTDPDTFGNFTRYKTQILRNKKMPELNETYLTSFGSTFDDKFTSGKTLPFTINMGYSKNINFRDTASRAIFERQTKVYAGDTVNIKFMGIDYQTYQFWETLEYSRNSTGNPFASPTKAASNISKAIGVWGGYGSKVITIIAPK